MTHDNMCLQELGQVLRTLISNSVQVQIQGLEILEKGKRFCQATHILVTPLALTEPRYCFETCSCVGHFSVRAGRGTT